MVQLLVTRRPKGVLLKLVLTLKVKVKSLSRVRLFATRGLQPTKLLRPWDSPGNNTGVSCHFLLQGIFLKVLINNHFLFEELETKDYFESESESRSAVSDSLSPRGLYIPWYSLGQNTEVQFLFICFSMMFVYVCYVKNTL